ncbi:MAG TPA: hypothetical protein DCL54_15940, partial [Alphaproteobacteria bacterium]|nr:hypothetical protein [Alphaproteobacteria bacterium]
VTAGANPILITTDPAKAGAVSQIETYASLLKAQALIAETPAALSQLVKDHSNSAVFVDTPGLNHLAAEESAGMRDLLNASGGEAVWVCAAGGDTDDLIETAQAYARLGVRRAIFTRLDSTRRLGSIIAAASAGRIAMAHAASSAFLADGLETLNPHGVATRLLQGYAKMLPESAPAEAAELNTPSSS